MHLHGAHAWVAHVIPVAHTWLPGAHAKLLTPRACAYLPGHTPGRWGCQGALVRIPRDDRKRCGAMCLVGHHPAMWVAIGWRCCLAAATQQMLGVWRCFGELAGVWRCFGEPAGMSLGQGRHRRVKRTANGRYARLEGLEQVAAGRVQKHLPVGARLYSRAWASWDVRETNAHTAPRSSARCAMEV